MVTKLRIALAQVNATVGDLDGNAELIVEWTRRAAARGARVVVFPEMMLTGYPVEDLALRASFVEASIAALHEVAARLAAEGLGGIAVVTGYLDRRADLAAADRAAGRRAAGRGGAAATAGEVVITSAKHHLPNYGVFDEFRYFVPGNTLPVFRIPAGNGESVDAAIAICEDLWQDGGPVAACRRAGAALLLVPNASPYERGKDDVRLDLVRPAGPRGGGRAGLRQHGRRPGRAGLRRRLDPGRRGRRRCWPAGRSSTRRSSSPTWTCPPRRPRTCRATSRWTRRTAR